MAIGTPDKLIIGKIQFGSTSITTTWSSGDAYNGVYLSFTGNFEIVPQTGTYPNNQINNNLFDAYNINVGDKFALATGKIYTVKSITVNSETNADIEIEDTDLQIYINSQSADNVPEENNYGIFFQYEDGVAILGNLTQNQGAFPTLGYWIDDIFGNSITDLSMGGFGTSGSGGTSGTS
jgi:hypothetical protein